MSNPFDVLSLEIPETISAGSTALEDSESHVREKFVFVENPSKRHPRGDKNRKAKGASTPPFQSTVSSSSSSLRATQRTASNEQVNDFIELLESENPPTDIDINADVTESSTDPNGSESSDGLENSMSEQDIRDVLFEAGYPIETIENIVSSKAVSGMGDISNSTNQTESESETFTACAFDKLKDVRIKNVNNIIIGTLNINSLAPKLDQLSEVILTS